MLGRENFGCGSSREHAAWALMDYGFRVLIAPSFADIFYNNSLENGLLPIVLPHSTVEEMFQQISHDKNYLLTIDLEGRYVKSDEGERHLFEIDDF